MRVAGGVVYSDLLAFDPVGVLALELPGREGVCATSGVAAYRV